MRPERPVIHLYSSVLFRFEGFVCPQKLLTSLCIVPFQGSRAHAKPSHTSLCTVLFQSSQTPRKTCHRSLCISSCSRCLRTHKDLAYVAKYSYVAFRGACALTKIRHTFVRIPSGSLLEMSCAHTLAERASTKNIQTVRSHPRLSLHHSTPLPIPLSRLSRACPSCGCFSRVNLGSFH